MSPKTLRQKGCHRPSGFSLIEVVLVILALGLLFLPVLRYFFGLSKSVTDSWSSVKAAALEQSAMAEIQATPTAALMGWNGRVDQVGGWTRTVRVDYVTRVGTNLVVSGTPTTNFRVKVTLNKAGSNAISITTIVS